MKYTIESTIPTVQYGNIRQSLEVESPEQESEAIDTIKRLWSRFGEQPLRDKSGGGEELTSFTGEKVLFNEEEHAYFDTNGNRLISASQYANQFAKPFDKDKIIGPFAEKNGWSVDKVDDMWRLGNTISTSYGSALHECVEMMVKHADTDYVDKYVPVILQPAVNSILEHMPDGVMSEVLVSDVKNGRAGRIDFLHIDGNSFSILDLKTNREMKPDKLKVYAKQLSFYADVLIMHGYDLNSLDLLYFNGSEVTKINLDYEETI